VFLSVKGKRKSVAPATAPESAKTVASHLDFSDLLFTDMGLLVRLPAKAKASSSGDDGAVRDDGWFLPIAGYAWTARTAPTAPTAAEPMHVEI
jgi:hypothetical protein